MPRGFYVALVALLVLSTSHEALAQRVSWIKTLDSANGDSANAIAIDPSGNIVVGGTAGGRIDLGGTLASSIGGAGGYVAKYDQFRNVLWAVRHSGSGSSAVNSVATDDFGNVFVTGSFLGTMDFGGGAVTSVGYSAVIAQNVFVASYGSHGEFRWARTWGSGRDSIGYGTGVLVGGDVVVTGTSAGRFGMDGWCGTVASNSSSADIFLARLEGSTGMCKWFRLIGSPGDDAGTALSMGPLGDITVAGRFQGTVDFGGTTATAAGVSDIFVARFRPGGVLRWVRTFGGSGDDMARAVAVDDLGEIAVVGHFSSSVNFGGVVLSSAGSWDGFVVKLGPGGSTRWARALGGSSADEAWGVAFDQWSRVVVTGGFQGTANLGAATLTSAGSWDAFTSVFGPDGDANWTTSWGGIGADLGQAVAVDASNVAIVGGYFSEQARFGAVGALVNLGGADAFILGVQ